MLIFSLFMLLALSAGDTSLTTEDYTTSSFRRIRPVTDEDISQARMILVVFKRITYQAFEEIDELRLLLIEQSQENNILKNIHFNRRMKRLQSRESKVRSLALDMDQKLDKKSEDLAKSMRQILHAAANLTSDLEFLYEVLPLETSILEHHSIMLAMIRNDSIDLGREMGTFETGISGIAGPDSRAYFLLSMLK